MNYFTNSKSLKVERIEAFKTFISDKKPQLFITISPNRNRPSINYLRGLLRRFDAECCRSLFGRKFFKLPADKRIVGVAVVEHLPTNAHWHLLINIGQNLSVEELSDRTAVIRNAAEKFKSKHMKSGDIQVETVESERVIGYITKELIKDENWSDFEILPMRYGEPSTFI